MATIEQARERRRQIKAGEPPRLRTEILPWPRLADDGITSLGVDLSVHLLDVQRIMRRHFRAPCEWTFDDYVHEVCLSIMGKNRTASAHDPRKSSLGHYIYMVASGVGANAARREKNRRCLSLDAGDSLGDSIAAPEGPTWRAEAEHTVRRLAEQRRLSPRATGYCLEVLSGSVGEHDHGENAWARSQLRKELEGVLGAVGPVSSGCAPPHGPVRP